jgi:hypothetical protein
VSEPVFGRSEDSVRSPLVPTPSKPESSSPKALSKRSSLLVPPATDSVFESDIKGGGAEDITMTLLTALSSCSGDSQWWEE